MKALAGSLVALFIAEVALACTCLAPGEPLAELAQADAVFAGTRRAIRFVPYTVRVDGNESTFHHVEVEFRVRASWKGIRPDKVVLVTTSGLFCGFPLRDEKEPHRLREIRFGETSVQHV